MVLLGLKPEISGTTMGLSNKDSQSFAEFSCLLVKGRHKRSSGGDRAMRNNSA